MKLFNAFQLVVLFGLWPLGISWLSTATFPAHVAAFWVAIAAYVALFAWMVFLVRESMEGN